MHSAIPCTAFAVCPQCLPAAQPALARFPCRTLPARVTVLHQVLIWCVASFYLAAKNFLKPKLAEVVSKADATLPESFIQQVLIAIHSKDAAAMGVSKDQCESYINAMRRAAQKSSPVKGSLLEPLITSKTGDENAASMQSSALAPETQSLLKEVSRPSFQT